MLQRVIMKGYLELLMSKQGTLHLVYWREYKDDSEKYNPYFKTYYTIFRNAPLSQLDLSLIHI